MISGVLLSLFLMTSSDSYPLQQWIYEAAQRDADPSVQAIAIERVVAVAEIRATIHQMAKNWGLTPPKTGLTTSQIQDLTTKLLSRMPIEEIRKILIQIENPDPVVQLLGVKSLSRLSASDKTSGQPQDLALRLLYTKDYLKILASAYERSFQAQSEVIIAKKQKDLNDQVLQQLLDEINAFAAR